MIENSYKKRKLSKNKIDIGIKNIISEYCAGCDKLECDNCPLFAELVPSQQYPLEK